MGDKRQRSLDIPIGFTDAYRARLIATKQRMTKETPMTLIATSHPLHLQRRLENAAILTHEVNRAYCTLIGDTSQVPWFSAPQWQRDSAIDGVTKVAAGDVTEPGDSHANWLEHKKADGWTWGEVKDPEKKTHPSMKPFADLDRNEQLKDHLFVATAQGALTAYAPRTVYAEATMFDKVPVRWKAIESYMTLGMYVICGRMSIVFDSVMRAYDTFDGYPVPQKNDKNLWGDMVDTCMGVVDSNYPDGETPGERGIAAMQKVRWPQRIGITAHDTFAWSICHRIVHTVMAIEGVETIPRNSRWARIGQTGDVEALTYEISVARQEGAAARGEGTKP